MKKCILQANSHRISYWDLEVVWLKKVRTQLKKEKSTTLKPCKEIKEFRRNWFKTDLLRSNWHQNEAQWPPLATIQTLTHQPRSRPSSHHQRSSSKSMVTLKLGTHHQVSTTISFTVQTKNLRLSKVRPHLKKSPRSQSLSAKWSQLSNFSFPRPWLSLWSFKTAKIRLSKLPMWTITLTFMVQLLTIMWTFGLKVIEWTQPMYKGQGQVSQIRELLRYRGTKRQIQWLLSKRNNS